MREEEGTGQEPCCCEGGRAGRRRRRPGDALGGSGPFVGRTKWLRWISETVESHNGPSSAP